VQGIRNEYVTAVLPGSTPMAEQPIGGISLRPKGTRNKTFLAWLG